MSSPLDGDIISPPKVPKGGMIRHDHVWQHRYDLELRIAKPRYNRLILVTIGVGGILLSGVSVFFHMDQAPTHSLDLKGTMVSGPVVQKDAGISTVFRDALDAAPLPLVKTETQIASVAYTVVPTKRPVLGKAKSAKSKSLDRVSTTTMADVIRYDRCQPNCDINDRQAGDTDLRRNSASLPEVPLEAIALHNAQAVLAQTAALPFTTLKFGRDTVIRMSAID